MSLYSFTPQSGPMSGLVYYLPTSAEDSRESIRQNTLQLVDMQDGNYLSSGLSAMPMDHAEIPVTFDFYPDWLKRGPNFQNYEIDYYQGSNNDQVGLKNAVLHFMMSVDMGGVGTLVDKIGSGLYNPATGAAFSQMTADAIISGNTKVTYVPGAHATVETTIAILNGLWRLGDGSGTWVHVF